MAYTTRADALEVECPTCEVQPGDKCVGARGRKRESVHRERLNTAADILHHLPITTLRAVDARLVDADGKTVGRLHSVEFDVQTEGLEGNLRRGEGEGVVDVDVPSEAVKESLRSQEALSQGGGAGGTQASMLEDPVIETWQLYTELLERPKVVLTPKVRRWISDAHQAVGVERTNDAIRGLAASDYHRDHGYIGIEYAIKPKMRETVEGRVEMMAAKAATPTNDPTRVEALIRRLPSDAQTMVREWIGDIEQWLRYRDHPGLKATAERRLQDLRDKAHMEPVIEGSKITDWTDLR